ncbi:unnamed protein product [Caenorhabditis brenneri]
MNKKSPLFLKKVVIFYKKAWKALYRSCKLSVTLVNQKYNHLKMLPEDRQPFTGSTAPKTPVPKPVDETD